MFSYVNKGVVVESIKIKRKGDVYEAIRGGAQIHGSFGCEGV